MKIFTHLHVDIDAAFSVALYREFVADEPCEIEFVPASWKGPLPERAVALDVEAAGAGWKGRMDIEGRVHSAFEIVLACCPQVLRQMFAELACYIEAIDSGSRVVAYTLNHLGVSASVVDLAIVNSAQVITLHGVFTALRAAGATDLQLVEFAANYLRGIHTIGMAHAAAPDDAEKYAEVLGCGRVAIVRNSPNRALNSYLFNNGIDVIVYVDHFNLGVLRKNTCSLRMDHPKIVRAVEAAGELEEWFAHPAGFLFCRGSRKAPAATPSRVEPERLAQAVIDALNSSR